MVNKLVSLRVSSDMLKECMTITKSEGYASFQEFIRDAVRLTIRDHKLRKDAELLKGLQISALSKKVKPLTKKEAEKLALKLTEKGQRKLMKEFGIEDVTIR
ncbi:MAG: ribbon-helix-helix domain-containing protein [Candidatus Woesearchaeota archaeon]